MSSDNDNNNLHQEFLDEFKQLLEKYDAIFEVCDTGTEYYSNRVPSVNFSSHYDRPWLPVMRDASQLLLPDCIDPRY